MKYLQNNLLAARVYESTEGEKTISLGSSRAEAKKWLSNEIHSPLFFLFITNQRNASGCAAAEEHTNVIVIQKEEEEKKNMAVAIRNWELIF